MSCGAMLWPFGIAVLIIDVYLRIQTSGDSSSASPSHHPASRATSKPHPELPKPKVINVPVINIDITKNIHVHGLSNLTKKGLSRREKKQKEELMRKIADKLLSTYNVSKEEIAEIAQYFNVSEEHDEGNKHMVLDKPGGIGKLLQSNQPNDLRHEEDMEEDEENGPAVSKSPPSPASILFASGGNMEQNIHRLIELLRKMEDEKGTEGKDEKKQIDDFFLQFTLEPDDDYEDTTTTTHTHPKHSN